MKRKLIALTVGGILVAGLGYSYEIAANNKGIYNEKQQVAIEKIQEEEKVFFEEVTHKIKKETKETLEEDLNNYKQLSIDDVFSSDEEDIQGLSSVLMEGVMKKAKKGNLKPLIFVKNNKSIVIEKTVDGENNILQYEYDTSKKQWEKVSEKTVKGEKVKNTLLN